MRFEAREPYRVGGYIKLPEMREYLHKQVKTLWRKSVQAFIRAAATELSKNVDTGMSLGSLIPLGREVGMKGLIEAFIGGHRIRVNAYHVPSKNHKGESIAALEGHGDKSLSHGIARGEKAYEVDYGQPSNPEYYFSFTITVLQYYLHEHGLAVPNSYHWNSIEKGKQAFIDCWNQNKEKYFTKELLVKALKTGQMPTFYEE